MDRLFAAFPERPPPFHAIGHWLSIIPPFVVPFLCLSSELADGKACVGPPEVLRIGHERLRLPVPPFTDGVVKLP